MDNLNSYSLETIFKMMRERRISKADLARYIEEVVPDMEQSEEIANFLEEAQDYMEEEIVEVPEDIQQVEPVVEENEPVVVSPSSSEESGTTSSGSSDDDSVVVEDEEETIVEEPEVVEEGPIDDYPTIDNIENDSYQEAKNSMESTYSYCQYAGMNVEQVSLDGRSGRGPYITFSINNESKQFLDHLMLEFYQNSDGISLEFMRNMNKDEFFTIEVDPNDMSMEEFYAHVKDTFDRIYHTVETTKKDFEYEQSMPDGLQNIKDRFRNDDPNIGDDFTIGYVSNDGKDSYYIVADNTQEAVAYARSIGYDIKENKGSNIYEIDTKGNTSGTKLAEASDELTNDKEVYDIRENGVSDMDIYGPLETEPKVEMITNFIETSNDPHLMCMLSIEVPFDNPSQRIVVLKDESGVNEVLVFTDGDEFDKKVMPEVVETYVKNNEIQAENVSVTASNIPNVAYCQMESENNTTMIINGYDEEKINSMVDNITSKAYQQETNQNTNTKTYQKTMGTYPSNNSNNTDQSSAFVSMPVLFVISILFILMISLIIFAS